MRQIEPEDILYALSYAFRVVMWLCGTAAMIALTIGLWRLVTR